jgi:heparosan-N-sulfate-glucuronate 5-epimerase
MAQGQAASLLVRAYSETRDERFGIAAADALRPMAVPVSSGGVLAELDGCPFIEEYPTSPGSFVLNGALFALWGVLDVEALLERQLAPSAADLVATVARSLHRWDTGYWSRYDLYPHPVVNVASSFYHLLHIHQLEEFDLRCPEHGFLATASQFRDYEARRAARSRAFAHKAAFRLIVPRNQWLARHVPWSDLKAR